MLLLSFGLESQALRWMQETDSPFSLLLDRERNVYHAYGLERSALKSWHPKMFLRYARLLLKGWKLRPIQGDPNQLGGDFIIDGRGLLQYAHPSEDPADRPSVQELLEMVKRLPFENTRRENSTSNDRPV